MAILDISPTGSRSDTRPIRVTPNYLIVVEDPTIKSNVRYYISVKLDDNANSIRFVGFETKENVEIVEKNYQEMINAADKSIYKEMQVPLHRIIRIQNLIFKQK